MPYLYSMGGPWEEPTLVYTDEVGHQRAISVPHTGLSIGRATENALAFPGGLGVSRNHAEIVFDGRDWLVRDRGSRRGTWVNGVRVSEHVLNDGDAIQLGQPRGPTLWFRPPEQTSHVDEPTTADFRVASQPMTVMVPNDSMFLSPDRLTAASAEESGHAGAQLAQRIKALYQITSALLSVTDSDELSERLIEMIFDALPADRGAILFIDDVGQLVQRCVRVRPGDVTDGFVPSRTIAYKAAREDLAVLSLDATLDDRFAGEQSVFIQSIRAVMCAPVSSAGKVFAVAYVDTVGTDKVFDEGDLDFLVAVCRQAAMALERLSLLEEQKKTFESMVRAFAHSIDARDEMTAGHSSRVAKYSQAIARHLGLDAADCKRIWYAALLHDLGKIGTREAVLCKPGALTPEEYEHMKEHPVHTQKILSAINFTAEMADIPRMASSHHERHRRQWLSQWLEGRRDPTRWTHHCRR